MGQKCSCICNKENDQTYNFYPEASFNDNLDQESVKNNNISNIKGGLTDNTLFNVNMNTNNDNSHANSNNLQSIENSHNMIQESNRSHNKQLNTNNNNSHNKSNSNNITGLNQEAIDYIKDNEEYLIKIQSLARGIIAKSQFKENYAYLKQQSMILKKNVMQNYTSKTNTAIELMKSIPFDKEKNDDKEYRSLLSNNQKAKMKSIMNDIDLSKKKGCLYQDVLIDEKTQDMYSGYLDINNKKNGFGILVKNNGEVYEGNWIDDVFTGYGRAVFKDGEVIEGKFVVLIKYHIFLLFIHINAYQVCLKTISLIFLVKNGLLQEFTIKVIF